MEINRTEKSVTEEEIISIVDEAHEQGVIQENEAEMIQNIISFNETEAHDIMTHRKNVVAFDEEILLKNMIDTMLKRGIPVIRYMRRILTISKELSIIKMRLSL